MSQSYAIGNLLNNCNDSKKQQWSDQLNREKRITNKLPFIFDDKDLFEEVYNKMYSQKPEEVHKALSSYPILFITNIPTNPPSIDIINKLFEYANCNRFKEIRYEAANDLYIIFINFPAAREYLLQNKFYIYLFNHLNRVIIINFRDAIKIAPEILHELANDGAVESVFKSILDWESITNIEQIPYHEIYPPMDPNRMVHPAKENVLISNIRVFQEFLKYNIENAINLNIDMTNFLLQFVQCNSINKEIQLATLKYLAATVNFTWEILQHNGLFSYILKNCVDESLFDVPQYCISLKLLTKASYFCCDYLISEGLFSTIHAVFSKDNDDEYPEIFAIELCTAVVKNDPEKVTKLISESGSGLPKDFLHYSQSGSYPEKTVYMNFTLELIKSVNILLVSDFLASVSCVQFFADFLETSIEPIFIDILQALLHLIDLNKKNAISKSLSSHLNFVFADSSILKTIENFIIDDDIRVEGNDNRFVDKLINLSQEVIRSYSDQKIRK